MTKKIVLVDDIASMRINNDSQTKIVDKGSLFDFSKNEDSLAKRSRDFLNSLSCKSIAGKDILEWFRYKDVSLWWFTYRRIWPKVEECIRFTENFRNMLEDQKPDIVVIQGFFDKIDLIRQICRSFNIKVEVSSHATGKIITQYVRDKIPWQWRIYRFNRVTKRNEINRTNLANAAGRYELRINTFEEPIIYVADSKYRKEIFDTKEGKFVSGEHIVQSVLEQIKSDGMNLICIDVDYSYFFENKGLKKRLNDPNQYWLPFEILITNDIRNECNKSIKSVTDSILRLFKEKEFQKVLTYEGIVFWNTLKVIFRTIMSEIYVPNFILSIEAARYLLTTVKPRAIFLPYETGTYAMAFIVAAESLGIRTIGMQHGIIHIGHLDYSINNLRTNSTMGCPIPTLLILFGEFYRKLLVETFSYPDERVKVVGNPLYENGFNRKIDFNRHEAYKYLGFDSSRRTVLLATSGHQAKYGRGEYDVLLVKSLVNSFGGHEDIQVIVKVHPAEDPSVYSKVVSSKGANNFRVVKEFPIQSLISICDVFVSVLSTSILEAMVMKKPVIIAQWSEIVHRDLMLIAESGAAKRAAIGNISSIIIQVLDNRDITKELIDKSTEVVKSHFNAPSKGISKRIANIVVHNSDDYCSTKLSK